MIVDCQTVNMDSPTDIIYLVDTDLQYKKWRFEADESVKSIYLIDFRKKIINLQGRG